jgi:hypothetical protein
VDYSPDLLLDYRKFIDELRNLFDDPHAQRHACNSLKRLRQGKYSVVSYSSKFRHLALETGYNDLAMMDIFRSGLNDEVKDVLATSMVEPETLEDLIKLCVKIDQRLYDRRLEKTSSRMSQNYNYGDKWKRNLPQGGQSGSVPMDLDAMDGQKFKSHGKLTKEERERRYQNNLCLYCGESGHKVNSCPKRSERSLNAVELSSTLTANEATLSLKVSLGTNAEVFSALLDSGANSNFVSQDVIERVGLPMCELEGPTRFGWLMGLARL